MLERNLITVLWNKILVARYTCEKYDAVVLSCCGLGTKLASVMVYISEFNARECDVQLNLKSLYSDTGNFHPESSLFTLVCTIGAMFGKWTHFYCSYAFAFCFSTGNILHPLQAHQVDDRPQVVPTL